MTPPPRPQRTTADTLRRVVPALSVVVALAAVGGGAWWSQQRVPVESAVITRVAPELGPQGSWSERIRKRPTSTPP